MRARSNAFLWMGTALAAALLAPASAAGQDEPQPPAITVNGQGRFEVRPDQAELLLAVETFASNARDASRQNAEKMERVVAALRAAGLESEDIRTVSYQLNPEYRRPDRNNPQIEPERRIVGYRAVNMVRATIDDVDRTGAVIDAALDADANRVAGLSFGIEDEDAAKREALRRAMLDARQQAETVAQAAGVRLGAPMQIHVGHADVPRPPPAPMMMRAEAADMAVANTPIEAGELLVTAFVTAVYRIERP